MLGTRDGINAQSNFPKIQKTDETITQRHVPLQACRGLSIISKGPRVINFGALLPIKISRNNQIS